MILRRIAVLTSLTVVFVLNLLLAIRALKFLISHSMLVSLSDFNLMLFWLALLWLHLFAIAVAVVAFYTVLTKE